MELIELRGYIGVWNWIWHMHTLVRGLHCPIQLTNTGSQADDPGPTSTGITFIAVYEYCVLQFCCPTFSHKVCSWQMLITTHSWAQIERRAIRLPSTLNWLRPQKCILLFYLISMDQWHTIKRWHANGCRGALSTLWSSHNCFLQIIDWILPHITSNLLTCLSHSF